MKANVNVDATAQEMREFLGLPNVQPLHDDILKTFRDNVKGGMINPKAFGLFKPLLPAQFHPMEMAQQFWAAAAKAGGSAKDKADKKPDGAPESRDNDAVRNDAEKSA